MRAVGSNDQSPRKCSEDETLSAFTNVTLLLNFEGKSAKDLSDAHAGVVVKGDNVDFVDFAKVGTISASFDNSMAGRCFPKSAPRSAGVGCNDHGSYLLVQKSHNTQFSGDFTIEFWVYIESDSSAGKGIHNDFIASERYYFRTNESHTGNFVIRRTPSNALEIRIYDANTTIVDSPDERKSRMMLQKRWYHVALIRHGKQLHLYQDGVSVFNTTYTDVLNKHQGYTIGRSIPGKFSYTGAGLWFTGKIDEFRATNGAARYKGGASFAVPRQPFGVCTTSNFCTILAWDKEQREREPHLCQSKQAVSLYPSLRCNENSTFEEKLEANKRFCAATPECTGIFKRDGSSGLSLCRGALGSTSTKTGKVWIRHPGHGEFSFGDGAILRVKSSFFAGRWHR